ncbi:MAG: DUF2500 family protein [Clostridia bacterium]|nr:DUF2500 family protein [Clostridia bacterium]
MTSSAIFSTAFNCFAIVLFAVCWGAIIIKIIKSRYAQVKRVKAEVVDKYKNQIVTKHGITERYVVVFSAGGKRLAFDVSEFSFAGYRIKEKGTLEYKGNKIIDFK